MARRRRNKGGRRAQNAGRKQHAQASSARVENATITSPAGIGGGQDQGRGGRAAQFSSNPILRSRSDYVRAREWARLYYSEWTARKIVDIPVHDMLRERWTYRGLDADQTKILERKIRDLQFDRTLRQALKLERLIGGAAILIGVRSQNDSEDVAEPLDPDSILPGDLMFANVFPRTKLTNTSYDTQPLSPYFGRPETYTVWHVTTHVSRLLIFDGDPITNNAINDLSLINQSYDGFGVSVLASVYDDIIRSVGARQAGVHLINRAAVLLINNPNLRLQVGSAPGQEAIAALDRIAEQMSMYQAAMIDGHEVTLDQWSASFGSVPELLAKYLEIVSAADDIPVTRFLGQSPGGLNATGTSDLENYYGNIEDKRESRLRPQLEKFVRILIRSELPDVNPDDVQIVFPPLWNPSELEQAQKKKAEADTLSALVMADIIGPNQAEQEARELELIVTDPVEEDPPLEMDPDMMDALSRTRKQPDDGDKDKDE